MNHFHRTVAIWAILLMLLVAAATLMPGCGNTTPRQDFAAVNDAYIATVQTLLVARETGEFTEEEWQDDIVPLINLGNDLLNDYDEATQADVPADQTLLQINNVLRRLQPYLVRADE